MPAIKPAPYERTGIVDRYIHLFGEDYGFRIYGQHKFDTFDFTDRFPDKLILTSAIARYALFAMRPIPNHQPDEVAEDILNYRHPFNLLLKLGPLLSLTMTNM